MQRKDQKNNLIIYFEKARFYRGDLKDQFLPLFPVIYYMHSYFFLFFSTNICFFAKYKLVSNGKN